jgi:predicted transcriptional regulator
MQRAYLERKESENRKRIIDVLKASRKGMSIVEIMRETNLSRPVVKKHLEKLISIGKVQPVRHSEINVVYFWNKEEKEYEDWVELSDNSILYLAIMRDPWGKLFIRLKEARKTGHRWNDWEDIGAIMVDKKKINELISKLETMLRKLENYH